MAAGLGTALTLASTALPLNNVSSPIGGGMQEPEQESPDLAVSRARQRVQDLAGGKTGSFNVSLGGRYSNFVYIGMIVALMYFIARGVK